MKHGLCFFISVVLLFTPLTSLAQVYTAKTAKIGNDTYVKLSDIKKINTLSISNTKSGSVSIKTATIASNSNIVKSLNPSVVAIIGEDKNTDTETASDYYYSKIPSGLMHGSGVIISKDGRIITNNHVVEDMKEIYVVLFNKKSYKATLLYRNPDLDLALIKINCSNLKPIAFEKMSNINAGDDVMAIGTPLYFGWANSVTKGVISGLNRPVEETYTFIQTDASINPGNSGGPLVNMQGKLVGINTLGIEYFQGVNFSIPVENIEYFINHYNKFGKVRRCYTGLDLEESWLAVMGIPSDQGLNVIGIRDNGSFSKGQIKEGDFLSTINGTAVTSIASYNEILKKMLPGQTVKMKFFRDSKPIILEVKLKDYPEVF